MTAYISLASTSSGTVHYIQPTMATPTAATITNLFNTYQGTQTQQIVTGSGGGGGGNWNTYPQPWPPQHDIHLGEELIAGLPDGAKFIVEKNGSYRIEDKNAKVTYRANRFREFNRFLNASDRIEEFIKYCGSFDVSQNEMLDLPLKLFIMWLILEAASADEIPPEVSDVERLQLEFKKRLLPRCKCGRFISRKKVASGFTFCSGAHYDKYSWRT